MAARDKAFVLYEGVRCPLVGRKGGDIDFTTDLMRLSPWDYIEATLRNARSPAW